MIRVSIKLTGIQAKLNQLNAAKKDLQQIIDMEIEAAAQQWVALSKRDAPVDQGALRNAISYAKGKNISIVVQKFYAAFVEFGTKGKYTPIPGTEQIAAQFRGYKGGDIQEMVRNIERWLKRKGDAPTKGKSAKQNLRSNAWHVTMLILKYGISPQPFFFKQANIVWPDLIKRIEVAVNAKLGVSVKYPSDYLTPKYELI